MFAISSRPTNFVIVTFGKLGTIPVLLGEVHILFRYETERQEKDPK